MPEIPLRTFNIINYNHSVARVKNIYAGPSGLESTSLVFVYGLGSDFMTSVSLTAVSSRRRSVLYAGGAQQDV